MKKYDGDLNQSRIAKIYGKGFVICYDLEESEKYKKLDFEVLLESVVVAEAFFVLTGDKLHCNNVEVNEEYRRKGIATSLYVAAEYIFGCSVSNMWDDCKSQSEMGYALWQQLNRPFGNKP